MKKLFNCMFMAAVLAVIATSRVSAYVTPEVHGNFTDGTTVSLTNPEYAIDGDDQTSAISNEGGANGVVWGYPMNIPENYVVTKVIVRMLTDGVTEYDYRAQCFSSDFNLANNIQSESTTQTSGTDETIFVLDDNTNQDCFWANKSWYDFSNGSTFLFGIENLESADVTPNTYAESYIQMHYCSVLGGECSEEVLDPAEAPAVELPPEQGPEEEPQE